MTELTNIYLSFNRKLIDGLPVFLALFVSRNLLSARRQKKGPETERNFFPLACQKKKGNMYSKDS